MNCKCGHKLHRNMMIPWAGGIFRNYTCDGCTMIAQLKPIKENFIYRFLFHLFYIGKLEWIGRISI